MPLTRIPAGCRLLAALALACPLAAAAAAAQQEELPPKFELSPYGGVFVGADLYANAAGTPVRVDSKGALGGRLTWNVSPSFGLEGSWFRTVPTLDAPSTTLPGTRQRLGSLALNLFDLTAFFAYASPREGIYFSLGAGVARLAPAFDGATAGTDARPLFTAGLAYKRFFGGPIGVRVDLRYHGLYTNRATDIGILCGGTTGCYVYDGRKITSTAELSAGVVLRP
jgi:hypothetical protein